MAILLLYTGIVLIAVPLLLMIGFGTFIFFSFIRDDDTSAGILRVSFLIMGLGALLIVGYLVQHWLAG